MDTMIEAIVECMNDYYSKPENVAAFEEWKKTHCQSEPDKEDHTAGVVA